MKNFFYSLLVATILCSCQSVEIVENVVFDYVQFPKLTYLANSIEINNKYESTYEEPFLDHLIDGNPTSRVNEWIESNVKGFGVENKLVITIEEASISYLNFKSEKKIAGILYKPNEVRYDLKYELVFSIYNDNNARVAHTVVKATRSTTSLSSISLYERDQILDDLVYKSFKDLAFKSEELSKKYLSEYSL